MNDVMFGLSNHVVRVSHVIFNHNAGIKHVIYLYLTNQMQS